MGVVISCFLGGLLVGLPLSFVSGSSVAMTIREVPRRGAFAGIFASAGRSGADLMMLVAVGVIALADPALFVGSGSVALTLGLVAGAALAFLGWRLMEDRTAGALNRERGNVLLRAYHENPALDRLLATLLSPLRMLFWWTAGLRLAAGAAEEGAAGVAAFAVGFILAGIAWLTFVAVRLRDSRQERALSDRQYRIATSFGGLVLVAVGLALGVEAVAGSGVRGALERIVALVFG